MEETHFRLLDANWLEQLADWEEKIFAADAFSSDQILASLDSPHTLFLGLFAKSAGPELADLNPAGRTSAGLGSTGFPPASRTDQALISSDLAASDLAADRGRSCEIPAAGNTKYANNPNALVQRVETTRLPGSNPSPSLSDLGQTGKLPVAKAGGNLVAYAAVRLLSGEAEILSFATLPAFRRCGYGYRLGQQVLQYFKTRQIRQVFLEVRSANHKAIALYQRLQFEPLSVRRNYYRCPQDDAIVMTRRLASPSPGPIGAN